MSDFIGAAISATASHINRGIDFWASHNQRNQEYERQKEFAQNGIRWKVADAKAAGIHPIYAIGSNTPTYSPQAITGADFGFSESGQNIARAIEAKQTPEERAVADLQREGLALDNEYKRAQIEKVKSEVLWDELNFINQQYRNSESAISTAQTQRQPPMPSEVSSVGDPREGIMPYRYGDTYFDFPPEDVADTMEAPSAQAAWRSAVEVAYREDQSLQDEYRAKLIPRHRKMLKAGTHKLIRLPGIGVRIVPIDWTPQKSYMDHLRGFAYSVRDFLRPRFRNGGGGI